MSHRVFAVGLCCLAACTVGVVETGSGSDSRGGSDDPGDTNPGGPDAAPPDLVIDVPEANASAQLGDTIDFVVELAPSNLTDTVALSVAGLPDGFVATIEPAQVTVSGDTPATALVSIRVPTTASAQEVTFDIIADSSVGERTSAGTVAVDDVLIVELASGTGGGPHTFPTDSIIAVGSRYRLVNRDGTAHQIHASDGQAGFPHQQDPGMAPNGGSYEVTITQAGTYQYYCHTHGAGTGTGRVGATAP